MSTIADVLAEVAAECDRPDAPWGKQGQPDGTGAAHYRLQAESYRRRWERNNALGEDTWLDLLLKEVYEASAKAKPHKLRRELIRVAAVACAWAQDIDEHTEGQDGP
jgi:hypothetical protein